MTQNTYNYPVAEQILFCSGGCHSDGEGQQEKQNNEKMRD